MKERIQGEITHIRGEHELTIELRRYAQGWKLGDTVTVANDLDANIQEQLRDLEAQLLAMKGEILNTGKRLDENERPVIKKLLPPECNVFVQCECGAEQTIFALNEEVECHECGRLAFVVKRFGE